MTRSGSSARYALNLWTLTRPMTNHRDLLAVLRRLGASTVGAVGGK